jgi:hypothetical protein
LFLEAGGGAASARLVVTDASNGRSARDAVVPLAGLGAGWRVNVVSSGPFVELGLRSAVPLATRHLYTDDAPPPRSTRENVSYRSWYFGHSEPTSQFYAGVGIAF